MPSSLFKSNLKNYGLLSDESIETLSSLCQEVLIRKGEVILNIGDVPKHYYYVEKGLFSYYYPTDNGEKIIKKFFSEDTFIASLSALLYQKPSPFAMQALEESMVFKIPSDKFKNLITDNHDIALFYIKYLEEKWIKEKELAEITSKFDTADIRYKDFLVANPHLVKRLKQFHIASYLGITPTQLSRINKRLKNNVYQHM